MLFKNKNVELNGDQEKESITVNFRCNFIFANSIKRHICDAKKSRLGHDLPSSVNNRMILLFRVGFIFTKLSIC